MNFVMSSHIEIRVVQLFFHVLKYSKYAQLNKTIKKFPFKSLNSFFFNIYCHWPMVPICKAFLYFYFWKMSFGEASQRYGAFIAIYYSLRKKFSSIFNL